MPTITLPDMPKEKEFEEYCSALLQTSGHYVERNVIERDVEEVLELDIIVTDYDTVPPEMTLVEVKSKGWGFADIFKASGWRHYLGLPKCKVVVAEKRDNMGFVTDKAEHLGIGLVLVDDPSDYQKAFSCLAPGCSTEVDENDVGWWRYSYWLERKLLRRLLDQKKNHLDKLCFKAASQYYQEVNGNTFFMENVIERVHSLYKAFSKYQHLTAKTSHELAGDDFDDVHDTIPDAAFKDTFYKCDYNDLHVCLLIEHRARLAVLKSVVDYKAWKDAGVVGKTEDKKTEILGLETSLMNSLPSTFKAGMDKICKHKYCHRYPVFWQWFMWLFGGFILQDHEAEEYKALSQKTGIPVAEIPNALNSYEILFPTEKGWFLPPSSASAVTRMKMFPAPFHGVGANYRRHLYTTGPKNAIEHIRVTGVHTKQDLLRWNNLGHAVLSAPD